MQQPLLSNRDNFNEESYADVVSSYSGFGADLFNFLSKHNPDLFSRLRFFRSTRLQSEDVFAIYESGNNAFGIMLDPDCEVICLWNGTGIRTEIGAWSENEYEEAFAFINEYLLTN